MNNGNQFLGTERIGTLMRQYAVPCIISLLVGALYNIVDQIFIANASYLGSYGNAANTVVFPLAFAPRMSVFLPKSISRERIPLKLVSDNLVRIISFI